MESAVGSDFAMVEEQLQACTLRLLAEAQQAEAAIAVDTKAQALETKVAVEAKASEQAVDGLISSIPAE
eukprot:10973995-Lingulodinium_polyedra.AAC.1